MEKTLSVVQSESIENDVFMSEVDGFEDVFASQSAEESQTCTVLHMNFKNLQLCTC